MKSLSEIMIFNKRICLLFAVILFIILLTGCGYKPPEGYTKKNHTYEELVGYAKSIDPDSTVSDNPKDVEENHRTYRIYPAVINGKDCSVASTSREIYDDSLGEFSKTYYRMDTDYDYYVICDVLGKYPALGTVMDDSVSNRFHVNDVISSEIDVSDISSQKLDELFGEYRNCCLELEGFSLRKKYWLNININDMSYYFTEPTDEEKQKVYDKMVDDGVL